MFIFIHIKDFTRLFVLLFILGSYQELLVLMLTIIIIIIIIIVLVMIITGITVIT